MHSCTLVAFEPLNTNQESTDQQNKSCLLSSPDPLRGGAYNFQSIKRHPRGKPCCHGDYMTEAYSTELWSSYN